jgi:hypothetical protein
LHDDVAHWLGELTETFGRAVKEPEELDGDLADDVL